MTYDTTFETFWIFLNISTEQDQQYTLMALLSIEVKGESM